MRLGYMSSVCPTLTLAGLIETAERYGYEGIEFRTEWGHAHGVELDATPAQLAAARRVLADAGIVASCIATSVRFNAPDPREHLSQRDTLRRYVALAAEMGAPVIRTFSDPLPEDDPVERERVMRLAAESYAAVDAWAGQHGVVVLVETHTNMRGAWARRILDAANAKNLGALWHIAHHVQRGESVDAAYGALRGHVHHLHFTATEDDPVVADADNRRSFALLADDGFDGFFSVEIINPEAPEDVLAHHHRMFTHFKEACRVA